jgi:hypothetical protein
MAIELDLTNKSTISAILTEAEKTEERERRTHAFNAYQMYSGNVEGYVKTALEGIRPKSHNGYTLSDISLSGMITDKRAQAYNESPIRGVDGADNKTDELSNIYREADADEQLQFFDVVFNLNRYALMWVNYLFDKKRYQFITMHPYEAVLIRDKDDGTLLAVGLNYPNSQITSEARRGTFADAVSDHIAESQADGGADSETWVFWSATQHVKVRVQEEKIPVDNGTVVKKNIDYVKIPNNPRMINPLGVLPFIYKSVDTSVDYPVVNPLTSQTLKFNLQQSETLTSKNIHGSGVQVFKYPEKYQGKFDRITHGLMGAIELPQSSDPDDGVTDFEYLTSGAQLLPMKEIDSSYLEQVAKQHGLENFSMEPGAADVQSGISKAIEGASVQKIIEKNQRRYSKLEKDIFDVIKAWEKFLGSNRFSQDDELQVVFPKPKVHISDRETLENIEKQLDLGLIEEWEKFIKIDPNLTEQEAKEKLERIESQRMERAKRMVGFGNNQERVDQEGEPEFGGDESLGEE